MAARKVRSSRTDKETKRRRPAAYVDVCGQRYAIIVDPTLKIDGECCYSDNVIRIKPQAYWRMVDTYLHELTHAWLDASGAGWQIRSRLKMTQKQWQEFEEDFIVRPMTPAMLTTLRSAGMFKPPAFLRKYATAA